MSKQIEFGDRNGGSWGTIKVGRKGWTVETHSRYQGTRTGTVAFVPFDAPEMGVERTDNLAADYNDHMSNANYITWFASEFAARCTVRRRGTVVQ